MDGAKDVESSYSLSSFRTLIDKPTNSNKAINMFEFYVFSFFFFFFFFGGYEFLGQFAIIVSAVSRTKWLQKSTPETI